MKRKVKPSVNRHHYMDAFTYRQNISERMVILESDVAGIKNDVTQIISRFDTFTDEMSQWRESQGKPNWNLILGFFAILATSGGGFITLIVAASGMLWFLISTQMTNEVNPIKANVQVLEEGHKNLDSRTSDNTKHLANLDAQDRARIEKLKEVETQFRANDEMRNMQYAQQTRNNINTQNALNELKATFPKAPETPFYFPHITKPDEGLNDN